MTHDERNEAIKQLIRDHTKVMTQSREIARSTLIAEGIYTKRGQLRAEFGGKSKKTKAAA